MINHSDLATKLNTYFYKDTITNIEEALLEKENNISQNNEDNIINDQSDIQYDWKSIIISYFQFVINILSFGYSAELLTKSSWTILGILVVGYSVNFILNKILKNFSPYNK